jgi:Domain of unknown function (DUF4397)
MKATIRFKHYLLAFLAFSTILLSSSCNGDDPATPTVKEYGKLLLFHGAPGAPAVDLFLNSTKQTTTSLVYGLNSGYVQVEAGTTVNKIQTKTATGVQIDSIGLKVNKDVGYSNYAYVENDAAKSVKVLVSTDVLTLPAATKAKVRLVHLISDIAGNVAVDVETVAPGGVASARNDFTNVKFKDIKDFIEIAKGTYDVKIKLTGTTNLLLTVPNITLAEGKIYTLVAYGLSAKVNTDAQSAKVAIINNN